MSKVMDEVKENWKIVTDFLTISGASDYDAVVRAATAIKDELFKSDRLASLPSWADAREVSENIGVCAAEVLSCKKRFRPWEDVAQDIDDVAMPLVQAYGDARELAGHQRGFINAATGMKLMVDELVASIIPAPTASKTEAQG